MKRRAILLAGAALALASRAPAQTAIVPDTQPGFATGTTVTENAGVSTIDGGRLAGSNLFHSFSRFDVGAGDTARWESANADSILNVINRVTGGTTSHIDGTIDSTALPRANFWFINPAGVVFGDGAQVNVPGAAHFSTAQEIVQADGTRFSTVTPDGSTLSVAAPEAFGFLGGQGDIQASGFIGAGEATITLSAANIGIADADITAGSLTLVGVGDGPASFNPAQPFEGNATRAVALTNASVTTTAGLADGTQTLIGGSINLDSATLQSSTSSDVDAGRIALLANTIDVFNSTIDAGTFAAGDAGDVFIAADTVTIEATAIFSDSFGQDATGSSSSITIGATNDLNLRNATLSTKSSGFGDAGIISLSADALSLDFTDLTSDAGEFASGVGGLIQLDARTIDIVNGSNIQSRTAGEIDGGFIRIDATERLSIDASTINSNAMETASGTGGLTTLSAPIVELTGGTALETSTAGSGDAGAIEITGNDVFLDNVSIKSNAGLGSTGDGGLVSLTGTDALTLFDSKVETTTRSVGEAGVVLMLDTGDLRLVNSQVMSNASPSSSGNALGIFVKAHTVELDGGHLTSDTFGDGAAGTVSVTTDQLVMTGDGAEISTDSLGAGNAGQLMLDVGSLFMESDASISSSTFLSSTGGFGQIALNANDIAMFDDARIETNSRGLSDGGDISVNTGTLFVSGGHISSNTAFSADGNSGNVDIVADSIRLQDGGNIASDTRGFGDAGNVTITANTLSIASNGFVSSDSLGCTDGECSAFAGTVDVVAGKIDLSGGGSISTNSNGPGAGGDIRVQADTLQLNNGRINADTLGCQDGCVGGNAGRVAITAGTLSLTGANAEISSDTTGSGDAGDVTISSNTISLANGADISSSAIGNATGFSGRIDIQAGKLSFNGGAITTATEGPGDAGSVTIDVGQLALTGGLIASDSRACSFCFAGNAGNIAITADSITSSGGVIRSDTSNSGDAGFIDITAKTLAMTNDALISSRGAVDSTGNAGFITIKTDVLTLQRSELSTTMQGFGIAGNIDIATGTLDLTDGSTISSASVAPGEGYAGLVFIKADSVSLASGSSISTSSVNATPDLLAFLQIDTPNLLVTGAGSTISTDNLRVSNNPADTANQAGDISISSKLVRISEGGLVTSSSISGAAGSIVFTMPDDGILRLEGVSAPGVITTSSGPGTGGVIIIQRPFAIISNGGEIRAQGQQRGAFAVLDSEYFINSFDRRNLVAVDGSIAVDASIYDVSAGTTTPTVTFLDASRVLSGQCAAARASGQTSLLSARPLGPYLRQGASPAGGALTPGGCS
ncbi:beta strand repeat-containing protein [Sphingomonas tabacisoli]|uniref:Beta strand repeat-containing protein n=1 Tax=Sphingomonas tabacisoli TaxID=2249466 RepID=A0ABW4I576_9SPHN